jgi:3-oxoacyl-[acyl-carrier protein] reductase
VELGLGGRVALIPAGSRGIGKACAIAMAAEGAHVAICGRDTKTLQETEQEIRARSTGKVFAAIADLQDPSSIDKFVDNARTYLGRISILVANSVGPKPGMFASMNDEDWLVSVDGILLSTIRLVRAVLPDMQSNGSGAVIAVQSASVKQPVPRLVLSSGVRPAIAGLFKALSNDYGPEGIRFNVVCPGRIRTQRLLVVEAAHGEDLAERATRLAAEVPMRRLGNPEDVADMVTFLASDRAKYVTGTVISVDGGNMKGIF